MQNPTIYYLEVTTISLIEVESKSVKNIYPSQQYAQMHACSVTQLCPTFCDPMDCRPPGSLYPWIFPVKNTEVGCHFLLQEIFLTQELNSCLFCQILYNCAICEAQARRSNQSILKEISPEYSFERLMLKLNLHYFGHLMGRTNSLEQTLMLERTEGRRRRG